MIPAWSVMNERRVEQPGSELLSANHSPKSSCESLGQKLARVSFWSGLLSSHRAEKKMPCSGFKYFYPAIYYLFYMLRPSFLRAAHSSTSSILSWHNPPVRWSCLAILLVGAYIGQCHPISRILTAIPDGAFDIMSCSGIRMSALSIYHHRRLTVISTGPLSRHH